MAFEPRYYSFRYTLKCNNSKSVHHIQILYYTNETCPCMFCSNLRTRDLSLGITLYNNIYTFQNSLFNKRITDLLTLIKVVVITKVSYIKKLTGGIDTLIITVGT